MKCREPEAKDGDGLVQAYQAPVIEFSSEFQTLALSCGSAPGTYTCSPYYGEMYSDS